MPTVQQWGRRESIIWPPRGYLYTLGAFFLACVATDSSSTCAFNLACSRSNATTCPTTCAAKRRASRIQPANTRCCMFQTEKTGPRRARSGCATGFYAAVWRQATATDANPGSRNPWHLLPHARGPAQLSEQGNSCVDCALDIRGCSALQPLQDAALLWAHGVRPATSIFDPKGHRTHQATALRTPPQRPRARECEGVHCGRIRAMALGSRPMISSSRYASRAMQRTSISHRGRHRIRQVEHHPPDALPGRCARRQRHRL
jgi:hypothetical protein